MAHDGPLRILVVGQAACGKTSLIRSICHGDAAESRSRLQRTVGCHADVSTHVFRGRTLDVEWLEVGAMEQHQSCRSVYYRHFDGVVAVFDAGSERSFVSASEWLAELADVMAERELRKRAGGDGSRRAAHAAEEEEGRAAAPPSSGGSGGARRRGPTLMGAGGSAISLHLPQAPPPPSPDDGGAAASGAAAAGDGVRAQLMLEVLRRTPILLLANKFDLLPPGGGGRGSGAGTAWCGGGGGSSSRGGRGGRRAAAALPLSRYLAAIARGASRCKLDVPRSPLSDDSGVVTVCGLTCRRPKRSRMTLELPVGHAAAGTDELPREVLDAFLDDAALTAASTDDAVQGLR